MSTTVFRLDITEIFCDVDDFCKQWEHLWQQIPQLPSTIGERRSQSRMCLSEVMTIVIAFHGSGYRTFFEELYERGLEFITKSKKNRLLKLIDKILLRKQAVIESVNDYLKNVCQI